MNKILEIFKKHNSFALFTHISPDADTLGSANALRLALKKMRKKAYIFCDGKVPKNLKFLGITLDKDVGLIKQVDVCVMIDCNSIERIGKYANLFDACQTRINIDHHQLSDYKFDASLVDVTSPSTADLVFELIKKFDIRISHQIALNLYAGLSTDTGCFQHSSTNAQSFKHSYELLEHKFDLAKANYNLFKYKQKKYLFFYKTALRNTKPYCRGQIFVTHFSHNMYKNFRNILDDSNCFMFLDGIDGNEIRVKVIEKQKDVLSVSFRSNLYANVCEIAKKFGGGGHIRASGCTVKASYKEFLPKIIEECKLQLKKKD